MGAGGAVGVGVHDVHPAPNLTGTSMTGATYVNNNGVRGEGVDKGARVDQGVFQLSRGLLGGPSIPRGSFGWGFQRFERERRRERMRESAPTGSLPDLTCSTLLRTARQRQRTNGRGVEEPGVLEGASGRTKRGKALWVSERVRRGSAGPLG